MRKDLYRIENKKRISTPEINEIEKNFLELDKNLHKLKKYYDHDDIAYQGIRDVRNLFGLSIDEDYYKPTMINDAFNCNYIEYESKGDND